MLVSDVAKHLEKLANKNWAEGYDNVGLIIGNNQPVNNILLALDVNMEVVDEAIQNDVNLIVTHHPYIFKGINKINSDTEQGNVIMKLIRNNISVYTAHTNLDSAFGGTNDVLFDKLELVNKKVIIENTDGCGLGRIGDIESTNLSGLLNKLKQIGFSNITYCEDKQGLSKQINKVGLCTGSCMQDMILKVKDECDVYITGDVTYHVGQIAKNNDIAIVDITHYESEVIVLDSLMEYIQTEFDVNVLISEVDGQTLKRF